MASEWQEQNKNTSHGASKDRPHLASRATPSPAAPSPAHGRGWSGRTGRGRRRARLPRPPPSAPTGAPPLPWPCSLGSVHETDLRAFSSDASKSRPCRPLPHSTLDGDSPPHRSHSGAGSPCSRYAAESDLAFQSAISVVFRHCDRSLVPFAGEPTRLWRLAKSNYSS